MRRKEGGAVRFTMFLVLWAVALCAGAAELAERKTYGSPALRGRIVDETGAPVPGVIVVTRWDWLRFYPAGIYSSPQFVDEGEVLHVGEVVTGADGRYNLAAWGPVVRASGKAEAHAFLFKPGYVPRQLSPDNLSGARLTRSVDPPVEYAKSLALFQRDGLKWDRNSDEWKRMPRMVLALHREKVRLAQDGARVLGAYRLKGRAGEGEMRLPGFEERQRTANGTLFAPAVLAVAWPLRSDDGKSRRRIVQQRNISRASVSRFFVSPWRHLQTDVPGFSVALDEEPTVRVYAAGYVDPPARRWPEGGGVFEMARLPDTREAALAQLRRWRRDIDAELALGDPDEALARQQPLLAIFASECARLTLDARAGICFDPGSKVARSVQVVAAPPPQYALDAENNREPVDDTVAGSSQGSMISGMSVGVPISPGPAKPVDGFVIRPVDAPERGPER